jgi:AraC family transcriptional regulator
MVATAGRGRILMWEGGSLWLMEALPAAGRNANSTDFHSHHAVQLTFSLGARFQVRTRYQSISSDCVVGADVSHVLEAVGLGAILFVEPESRAGRAIAHSLLGKTRLAPVPDGLVDDLIAELKRAHADAGKSNEFLIGIGRSIIARLAGFAEPELPDRRVRNIIAQVASRLDDPMTLAAAAKSVDLSPGRLRHLFVEQTGLPFRTYLLWLRLTKAVAVFAGGRSLTEAAHQAGFSDSAHFSRTFRRMFGLPAAALQLI